MTAPGRCAAAELLVPPAQHMLPNEHTAGVGGTPGPVVVREVDMMGDTDSTYRGAIEAQDRRHRR